MSHTTDLQRSLHARSTKQSVPLAYLMFAVLLFMLVYFSLPLIWLLISSTKSQGNLLKGFLFSFSVKNNLWHNVVLVSTFQGAEFWRWFANSIGYSAIISTAVCVFSSTAAFALARYRFKFRGGVFFIIVASMMIPPTILVIPVFMLEQGIHIINTYWAFILPSIASPFGVYLLTTYMGQSVPSELLEAARIDGSTEFRIFRSIVLPISRPGVLTLFIITFIGSWNNFFLPLVVLDKSSLFPLSLGLDSWLSLMGTPEWANLPWYPMIITGSAISILPVIVLFPFLSRYIAYGLTQGSVKG